MKRGEENIHVDPYSFRRKNVSDELKCFPVTLTVIIVLGIPSATVACLFGLVCCIHLCLKPTVFFFSD